MLFQFLKYIKSTSYFSLKNKEGEYIFPVYSELGQEIKDQLEIDEGYKNVVSRNLDLSYQAITKGYIGGAEKLKETVKLPVEDEYRFIKKYYNSFWLIYALVFRLLTLHNPIKEFKGFLRARKITRKNIYGSAIKYQNWNNFTSKLVAEQPKISIIIPTLNRYKYLRDGLLDLEKQDYKNFDVIIVDQSEPFQKEFYDEFDLNIKLIHQEEKALWLARNRAIELSDADYLLLYDDDSRVDGDWVSTHLKCLDFFQADISSGVSISLVGAEVPKDYAYFKHSEQLDTGNVLITRKVFKTIGLFDRQYEKQRMGDGEYGLRAYLEGFKNISNPYAQRLHLKVGTGGLRQMGSWDGFRPKKWLDPRPIPSVVYQFRKYYGTKMTIYSLFNSVPQSIIPYRHKGKKKALLFAYVSLILIWPLILIQVLRSWKLSSYKLAEGAKIEFLKNE